MISEIASDHQTIYGFSQFLKVLAGIRGVKRTLCSDLARYVRSHNGNVEESLVNQALSNSQQRARVSYHCEVSRVLVQT